MNESKEETPNNNPKRSGNSPLSTPIAPIVLAIWLGLVFGYLEVLFWLIQRSMIDPFTYLSRDHAWMAPAAFDAIHPFASAFLAMGLAYQASCFLKNRLELMFGTIHRSLVGMALLLLVLIGASHGWSHFDSQMISAGRTTAYQNSPNVILIVMDTVRAQSLSLYGHLQATSPNLERWAKTAILFENALSTSPWTLPAHASLFTGRYPHQLSTSWHSPLDANVPTLAEILSQNGYRTSGFVANTTYCSYETGLHRGFVHYEDYKASLAETFRSSSLVRRSSVQFFGLRRLIGNFDLLARKNAAQINRDFLTWLDKSERQPFFTFLNYFDAHDPYLPPAEFARWGPQSVEDYSLICHWWALDKSALAEQKVNKALQAYEGAVRYVDDQIGRLLNSLEKRGYLENTIVVITSDHGEAFGEHGLFGHGNCLYRSVIQVPLMISYPPHLPMELRLKQPVSLRDIPATVLDLIGLPEGRTFPGRSLSRFWHSGVEIDHNSEVVLSEIMSPSRIPPDQGRSPISKGPMKSIVVNSKQYIRNYGDGYEELYDLDRDWTEVQGLTRAAGRETELEQYRSILEQFLSENSQPH
jgi:arylsulfatase A-like enzyme